MPNKFTPNGESLRNNYQTNFELVNSTLCENTKILNNITRKKLTILYNSKVYWCCASDRFHLADFYTSKSIYTHLYPSRRHNTSVTL